jgi:hypothetical protein
VGGFYGTVLGFAFFNGLFFALGSLTKYGALKRRRRRSCSR